jgi:Zn-dependent M16 (insulinase) family peptidase
VKQLEVDQQLAGFRVTNVTQLRTAPAIVYELEHCASGARLVHYSCDDQENLFSISFPTPPSDDTGVPHILEHVVLSGSQKYPVKDPFFAMAKTSMATFLNAMTGSECTYYPVASNVKQDLFNLAGVYFDAVFHPLISEDAFAREGHHFCPADPSNPTGKMAIKGVVYSEMQAHAADPGYRFWRKPMMELLPNTIYVYESGGDPDYIPDLTYSDFVKFHRTFYSPSNALFFLYGDIPTSELIAFLSDKMTDFERTKVPGAVYVPEPWREPRRSSDSYPIGETEPDNERTYFGIFWLAGNALDPQELLLFNLLSTILIGNDAAPLKKAIVDSRLGKDQAYSGDHTVGPRIMFTVGLKGSEPDKQNDFESLVLSTLSRIAENPIDRELVESAFQQVAYRHLEVAPGYPLRRMIHALQA